MDRIQGIGIFDDMQHGIRMTPCEGLCNVDRDGIMAQLRGKGRRCFCDRGADDGASCSLRSKQSSYGR